jgi:hypothetical protein
MPELKVNNGKFKQGSNSSMSTCCSSGIGQFNFGILIPGDLEVLWVAYMLQRDKGQMTASRKSLRQLVRLLNQGRQREKRRKSWVLAGLRSQLHKTIHEQV